MKYEFLFEGLRVEGKIRKVFNTYFSLFFILFFFFNVLKLKGTVIIMLTEAYLRNNHKKYQVREPVNFRGLCSIIYC